MKFAYMVATPEIKGEKVTALRGDYDYLFNLLSTFGYDGVEFMTKDPFEAGLEDLAEKAGSYGLEVPVICTGEMYGEDRLSFGDPHEEVRREAVRRVGRLMEITSALGAHINVGRLRGRFLDDVPKDMTLKWVEECLDQCASVSSDVHLLIEPICREYENFILTTLDGVKFVKDLSIDNVRLMLDYIHMVSAGENLAHSIDISSGLVDHIHVCDSDRLPLGYGSFDLSPFYEMLKNVSYNGFISVESFPTGNPENDVKRSMEALHNMQKRKA